PPHATATHPYNHTCSSLLVPEPPSSSPLSLHDALPIFVGRPAQAAEHHFAVIEPPQVRLAVIDGGVEQERLHGEVVASRTSGRRDRKSTRLNSSHVKISYAVFCLKKKTKTH